MRANKISKQEFFSFYWQRLENIHQIEKLHPVNSTYPFASFNPEFNILISATLDSLAKYWDLTMCKGTKSKSHRWRLGEFLVTHADSDIWGRCSHLVLLKNNPNESSDNEKNIAKRISLSISRDAFEVFDWRDDPKLCDLINNQDFQSEEDCLWIYKSRYGEILYEYYRCSWLHELNHTTEIVTENGYLKEPHYCNFNNERKFVLPTGFIIQTLEDALDSFQKSSPDMICLSLKS